VARRRTSGRRQGLKLTVAGVVTTALLAAAGTLVWSHRGGAPAALQGGADDGLAGVGSVTTAPFSAASDLWARVSDSWRAAEKVAALEKENAELRQWKDLALALAERNARYEALLKASPGPLVAQPGADLGVTARMVLQGGGPFRRTLVANAGADHGVKTGWIVLNENGLVGRVVAVGRRTSRVLLLDDYNSRVPVMGQSSRVRAMVVGQSNTTPDLAPTGFRMTSPRLDFTVGGAGLREGERVVTSGDGGIFPSGVVVGTAERHRDGAWRVRLGAANAAIDQVRILPYAAAEAPEDSLVADAGPPAPVFTSRMLTAPAPTPVVAPPPRPSGPRPTPRPATAATPAQPSAEPVEEVDAAPAAPAVGPPPQ
jgi:rod shape-determining protein MreC